MSDSEDIPDDEHVPEVEEKEEEEEEGVDDEIDEEDLMEEITPSTLTGRWMHSGGDCLNVVKGVATFDSGDSYPLKVAGKTVEIDGWTASLTKSVADKIVWTKSSEDKPSFWTFESQIQEGEDGTFEVDNEEIDTSNIIEGKRRRSGAVDYAKLDAEMTRKEKELKELKERRMRQQNGEPDEYAGTDDELDDPPPAKKQKIAVSSIPQLPPISIEQLKQLTSEMKAAIKSPTGIESMKGDMVLDHIAKLASFPMTLAVLKETMVGKTVNSFRKHSNPKAGDSAKELVGRWKALM